MKKLKITTAMLIATMSVAAFGLGAVSHAEESVNNATILHEAIETVKEKKADAFENAPDTFDTLKEELLTIRKATAK